MYIYITNCNQFINDLVIIYNWKSLYGFAIIGIGEAEVNGMKYIHFMHTVPIVVYFKSICSKVKCKVANVDGCVSRERLFSKPLMHLCTFSKFRWNCRGWPLYKK